MPLILIADTDEANRRRISGFFNGSEYQVIEARSVASVLHNVLRKEASVILLGNEFDGFSAAEIIPLLRKCNQKLTIILISDEQSPSAIRRWRRAGIFYQALPPIGNEDSEELKQAVMCACHKCDAGT